MIDPSGLVVGILVLGVGLTLLIFQRSISAACVTLTPGAKDFPRLSHFLFRAGCWYFGILSSFAGLHVCIGSIWGY
jgi:hypothetical protein